MDNFDLRKYLAENRLLKPIEEVRSPKGSNVSDEKIRLYLSKDYPGAYSEEEVIEIINLYKTKYRDYKDPYGDLDGVAHAAFVWNKENGRDMITGLVPGSSKSSSPTIDFPELEDEFEGAMDAMVVEPEVYLQDIIDASAEEIVSDDYYEIMNAVEQGVYSAEEAVKLAKAWAKDKLSGLAENKLIKELSPEMRKVMDQEKAKVEDTLQAFDRENPDYRYKGYDINDHEGEIFVVYNTQADYDQIRGKEALLDLLSNFQFPVYLHYTVRDDYRSDNHDIYSKKGYELA